MINFNRMLLMGLLRIPDVHYRMRTEKGFCVPLAFMIVDIIVRYRKSHDVNELIERYIYLPRRLHDLVPGRKPKKFFTFLGTRGISDPYGYPRNKDNIWVIFVEYCEFVIVHLRDERCRHKEPPIETNSFLPRNLGWHGWIIWGPGNNFPTLFHDICTEEKFQIMRKSQLAELQNDLLQEMIESS